MFNKNQILKLRTEHELTQLEFARRIGTSRQLVGLWESGDVKPGMDFLSKMSLEFKVPVSYFFN